jgi:hypothetical protein
MDEDMLRRELDVVRDELRMINGIVEPLLSRRDLLTRRMNALSELMKPLGEPPPELARSAWISRDPLGRIRDRLSIGSFIAHEELSSLADTDFLLSTNQGRKSVRVMGDTAQARYAQEAAGSEGGADASQVITEILEAAGRPLHREDIYQRGRRHPLGPLNRSTMVTRLSKDKETFEGVGDATGYWALKRWPAGRYATALTRLERLNEERSELAARVGAARSQSRSLRTDLASPHDPEQATQIMHALQVADGRALSYIAAFRRANEEVERFRASARRAAKELSDEIRLYADPVGLLEDATPALVEPAEPTLALGDPDQVAPTEGGDR